LKHFLSLLVLQLFFLTNGHGQVMISGAESLRQGISISPGIQVLEDPREGLTIEDLLSDGGISFATAEAFVQENNRSVIWVRQEFLNQSTSTLQAVLKFNHMSHITAYLVKDGAVIEEAYGGEYSMESDRRVQDARLYLSLDIPAEGSTLYLKIRQRKNFAPVLDFELVDADVYLAGMQNRTFVNSLVFGCFGILFIYGIILYIGNRHRPYLWLSLTVIFKAVFFSQMIGYFTDVFTPDNPKFAWDMLVFLAYGSGITNILLIKDFLSLKERHPKFNTILNAVLILLGVLCLLVFYVKFYYEDYLLANKIGFLSYIPQGVFLVFMFIRIMPRIPVYKRPVVIGITGFAALTLVTSVNFLFNLEKSYGQYTWNEVIGTLAFLILYFYTLGREMQLNEKEKNIALAKINEITRSQKEELEKTVKERTKELEASHVEIGRQNDNLKERNDQIEILLKEIHHRVKNNLQVISSLLDLQSRGIENEEALATFMEGQNRVKAMALIHQKLYQNDDLASIDFAEYAKQLMSELASIYPASKNVKTSVSADGQTSFDIDTAIPLGLILNELISNAYKYGFNKENEGKLSVALESLGVGKHQLTVRDSGPGLPADFDFSKAKSLGLRLVRRLAKQLYGSVSYQSRQGAEFVIIFTDTYQRKAV
jgi:two-component sensor histidine kinase